MDGWLEACRSARRGIEEALAAAPTTRERARPLGRGEGGDTTVAVDRAAEDAVFRALEGRHAAGERFRVLSEERGEVDFGSDDVLVVVDPIDGSLNAKRGLPSYSVSIALADGPTIGDVFFGYVFDFGTGEEWVARRGEGARVDGRPLDPALGERRDADGRLELLAIESADPRWVARSIDGLAETAHRLRALGSIALSLAQVADARVDGMVSLRRARAFDAAAAALIVREAGGEVAFPRCEAPLGCPLDLEPRSPVVAARSPDTLAALAALPS